MRSLRLVSLVTTMAIFLLVVPPQTAHADTCDDQYLLTSTSPSPSNVLSVQAINEILTEHNNARRAVKPYATVMPMLKWNQKLADFAQEYMGSCVGMVHSTNSMRSNRTRFGFSYVGENLAAGTYYTLANKGGKLSVAAWNREISDWAYPACGSGKVCGHYTQNIWAATTDVGCGYANCPSQPYKHYWSCVYGAGGNYVGQRPYVQTNDLTKSAACTADRGLAVPSTTTSTIRSVTTTTVITRPTTTVTTTHPTTTRPSTTTTRLTTTMNSTLAPTAPPTAPPTTTAPPQPMPASCTSYFLTGQSPSTQLTTAQINILLDAHNKARREVKPYARRMPMLQWSQELANMAKEFTGRCLGLTFSDNNRRMNRTLYPSFDWWYVGELLAAGGEVKADNLQAVMDAWLEGGKGYSNPNCAEGVYCGAYKQVVWAETTHVGCAWSYCPNQQYGYYWICNYGVGGNIAGQTPYEVTPYVSESAECTADRYDGAPSEGAKDACDVSYFVTGSSPSPTLTVPQINVLLKGHNDLRRAVTPYANVMPMLQWSQELADFAQEYLDSCPGLVTSPVSRRHGASKFPQWWYVGENMVAGEDLAPDFIGDAILAWSAGGEGWEYPRTCKPGYYCTAFMQMIWAETTHIGCAYKYCPNQPYKYYWVCNYGVGGSIQGESPYAEQRDLTQSASCTRDRSAATASRRAMGARSASFNASKYAVVSSEEVPDLVQSTEPEQETTLAIGTDAPRTKEIIDLAAADVRQIALASYTSPLRVTIAMTAVGLLALALGC